MRGSSKGGYTLIEILVVVTIVGILATISLPDFIRWLHAYRLQAAAVKLVNDLQATKLLAMLKGKKHQMQLRPTEQGNYYQIVEDPGGIDRIVSSIGRVILDKEFGGVIIKETRLDGTFTFSPKGTSTNGKILLENAVHQQIRIWINNTGRVRVEAL